MLFRRKPIRIILVLVVTSIIFGLSIIVVQAVNSQHPIPIIDLSAGAAEAAVRDTMQIQANNLQQFQILSNEIWGTKRILLYTYIVQPLQQPPRQEVGYALTEIRNGWSTIPGKFVADTQRPEPITYSTSVYNEYPIVYGRIRDSQVQKITVVFDTGAKVTVHRSGNGVLITGPRNAHVRELFLYDSQDNLIKAYQTTDVSDPPKWK